MDNSQCDRLTWRICAMGFAFVIKGGSGYFSYTSLLSKIVD